MSMTEKDLAEDYRMVLHEAKSMGCNEIKALYNIQLKNMEMIVQALEKQRYIAAKIEWLKTLNQFEMILVSDVLDWFEDAKVEE